MHVSPHAPELLQVLSCVVMGRHLGHEGQLYENDEDDYPEDSDYEDGAENLNVQVSQDPSADLEQKAEQKLFSVLKFGSSVA
jgi:hypothetical protein